MTLRDRDEMLERVAQGVAVRRSEIADLDGLEPHELAKRYAGLY
jgi:hypothetical protein